MRKLLTGTFSVLLLSSPLAAADQLHETHLNALDSDKDGAVSRAEYEAVMDAAFRSLDTNGDGSLSVPEASRVLTPTQFAMVDTNKNGRISRAEFKQQVMKDFDSADKNRNGGLG